MFQVFGQIVARFWPLVLLAWVAALVAAHRAAPPWESVAESRELAFLPQDSPTLQAQRLFEKAFPTQISASNIVIVVHREDSALHKEDKRFIRHTLKPRLQQIAVDEGGLVTKPRAERKSKPTRAERQARNAAPEPIISRIWTIDEGTTGKLLLSADGQAALAILELTTEFLDKRNGETVASVEALLAELKQAEKFPAGLQLSLGGSAVVGRDTLQATIQSAKSTESWTVGLVVVLLLIIYRAPFLTLIPLLTVFVAVDLALKLLAILADHGYLQLFEGLRSYITVIAYGAGVDFALFLTARYKEELDAGATPAQGVPNAIGKIGVALVASAGTQIGGIAMMYFAAFGKFHLAGIGMPFALVIVLCAALTFSPALLRMTGAWAFWPQGSPRYQRFSRWCERRVRRWMPFRMPRGGWEGVGQQLRRKPGTIWLAGVGLMAPFAIVAILFQNHLSYGLLSQLPDSAPSLSGTAALRDHFPGGASGPITLVVVNPDVDFSSSKGLDLIGQWTSRLDLRKSLLRIADLRSSSRPLGSSAQIVPTFDDPLPRQLLYLLVQNLGERIIQRLAVSHYVSKVEGYAGHVTRLDLVLEINPFTREAIQNLDGIEAAVREAMPEELRAKTELHFLGSTASLRDLKSVADRDRVLINVLVVSSVLVILMLLLRKPVLSIYLILSVVFSYFTTLGVTLAVFATLGGPDFPGLSWTVPTFLFTVLVAVGADYNIFLVTRIEDEMESHPPLDAIQEALSKTGRIISSCGIIMAGTFSSLIFGGILAGMVQLGFALTFGVLLDTFVVRPVLVPALLIMLHEGRFGRFGKYLGATVRIPPRLGFDIHRPPAA